MPLLSTMSVIPGQKLISKLHKTSQNDFISCIICNKVAAISGCPNDY